MPEPKASLAGRDCPLGKTLEHPRDVRWKGLEGRIKTVSTQSHTHTYSQRHTQIIWGLVWHCCQGAVKGKDKALWHAEHHTQTHTHPLRLTSLHTCKPKEGNNFHVFTDFHNRFSQVWELTIWSATISCLTHLIEIFLLIYPSVLLVDLLLFYFAPLGINRQQSIIVLKLACLAPCHQTFAHPQGLLHHCSRPLYPLLLGVNPQSPQGWSHQSCPPVPTLYLNPSDRCCLTNPIDLLSPASPTQGQVHRTVATNHGVSGSRSWWSTVSEQRWKLPRMKPRETAASLRSSSSSVCPSPSYCLADDSVSFPAETDIRDCVKGKHVKFSLKSWHLSDNAGHN